MPEPWTEALRLDPANRFVDAALRKASLVRPDPIKKLELGSFWLGRVVLHRGNRFVAAKALGGVAYVHYHQQPRAGGDLRDIAPSECGQGGGIRR
jgi:hypothetical protein